MVSFSRPCAAQATICARLGLKCIVYMGAKDMERQALNVFRMRLCGAEVRHAHEERHGGSRGGPASMRCFAGSEAAARLQWMRVAAEATGGPTRSAFRSACMAQVRPVHSGTATLKDATSEAIRDWVTNVETTHYILGSAAGPHPYPMMVRSGSSTADPHHCCHALWRTAAGVGSEEEGTFSLCLTAVDAVRAGA